MSKTNGNLPLIWKGKLPHKDRATRKIVLYGTGKRYQLKRVDDYYHCIDTKTGNITMTIEAKKWSREVKAAMKTVIDELNEAVQDD